MYGAHHLGKVRRAGPHGRSTWSAVHACSFVGDPYATKLVVQRYILSIVRFSSVQFDSLVPSSFHCVVKYCNARSELNLSLRKRQALRDLKLLKHLEHRIRTQPSGELTRALTSALEPGR